MSASRSTRTPRSGKRSWRRRRPRWAKPSTSSTGSGMSNRTIVWVGALLLVASAAVAATEEEALKRRVDRVLAKTPLIDGHNDVPWQVRDRVHGAVEDLPFGNDTSTLEPPMHTDLPRLRQGHAGGIFWSVYVP